MPPWGRRSVVLEVQLSAAWLAPCSLPSAMFPLPAVREPANRYGLRNFGSTARLQPSSDPEHHASRARLPATSSLVDAYPGRARCARSLCPALRSATTWPPGCRVARSTAAHFGARAHRRLRCRLTCRSTLVRAEHDFARGRVVSRLPAEATGLRDASALARADEALHDRLRSFRHMRRLYGLMGSAPSSRTERLTLPMNLLFSGLTASLRATATTTTMRRNLSLREAVTSKSASTASRMRSCSRVRMRRRSAAFTHSPSMRARISRAISASPSPRSAA
jgi:hypothetical protein